MKQLFLFILLIAFYSKGLHAQDSVFQVMNYYLAQANMKFTLPKGYITQKSNFYFDCDAYLYAPIHYTIMKKKGNILLGIYMGAYRPFSRVELHDIRATAAMFDKTFEMDSNYVYGVKRRADTVNHRIVYLSHEFVKRNYNGDRGVEYVRNCVTPIYCVNNHNDTAFLSSYEFMKDSTRPILKTYNHNRVLSISKDGRGHIELDYLYTDAISEKEIEKEIMATATMLQFNNN